MEIWKPVKNYEGIYEVSNLGRLKRVISNRCLTERILKHNKPRGYHQVTLCKNAVHERAQVHRLVAIAFIENTHNKPFVNHIDSDKDNNTSSNLEWCTQKENVKHSFSQGFRTAIRGENNANAKLKTEQALSIRFLANLGFEQRDIAREYGVSNSLVGRIATNKAWVHA